MNSSAYLVVIFFVLVFILAISIFCIECNSKSMLLKIQVVKAVKHKSSTSSASPSSPRHHHHQRTSVRLPKEITPNPLSSIQPSITLGCINYNPSTKAIIVNCKSANLSYINNQLKNSSILDRGFPDGTWLLNANLVINNGSTFHINSTDSKWLKIISLRSPSSLFDINSIHVYGNLNIDSVKITSWDPTINNYVILTIGNDTIPRSYIRVEPGGTTNITNSEIAYLGSNKTSPGLGHGGVNYYGGNGSILRGNEFHDLYYGPFTSEIANMTIEKNKSYKNIDYGFDPHTRSHDIIIRNNIAYDNGEEGIICSLDCYNILIENNTTYHNQKSGLMFSRNTYNSIMRNNIAYNEVNGIHLSQSHNNQIYNNTISNSISGINVEPTSTENQVYDNTIMNTKVQPIISDNNSNILPSNNNRVYSNNIK